ncbi:MAG: amino acid ABC transporter ATP-binding protein [Lentisphaeria bacterium]|nr:amino acid ABC transporter ATP-binding protein [Lentisphaeria bacterium]
MKLFSATNIKKSFGDNTVLQDISIDIEKGEVVSIIGPSGSGKTTFLRCAAMLETPDSGRLVYDGVCGFDDTLQISKSDLRTAKSKFGMVFQSFNLFPHFSVLRNLIDAPCCVQKRSKEELAAEALELLGKMGLAGKEHFYPCELSGGQQQRVAIARALMCRPEILFFDEPTSALDPELTLEILKVIRALAAEHMTMVIVTHELEFAKEVSDRIIFMADGVIVEEGNAKKLIDEPENERTRAFISGFRK